MATKQYQSLFVSEHKIDLANYITEIIICNYLAMLKKPKPASPFWRKEIAAHSPELVALSKKYQLELIGVKQLLKKFSGSTIAKYYTESKRTGFKGLKKENQIKILRDLEKLESSKIIKTTEPLLFSESPEAIILTKKFVGKTASKINL